MGLILVLTPGCFNSEDYLVGLCQMISWKVRHVLPVVTFDTFAFPGAGFYSALEASVSQLCLGAGCSHQPELLHNFVQAIFKKICTRVMVLGSSEMLQVQATVVYRCLLDEPRLELDLSGAEPKTLEFCKVISHRTSETKSKASQLTQGLHFQDVTSQGPSRRISGTSRESKGTATTDDEGDGAEEAAGEAKFDSNLDDDSFEAGFFDGSPRSL